MKSSARREKLLLCTLGRLSFSASLAAAGVPSVGAAAGAGETGDGSSLALVLASGCPGGGAEASVGLVASGAAGVCGRALSDVWAPSFFSVSSTRFWEIEKRWRAFMGDDERNKRTSEKWFSVATDSEREICGAPRQRLCDRNGHGTDSQWRLNILSICSHSSDIYRCCNDEPGWTLRT